MKSMYLIYIVAAIIVVATGVGIFIIFHPFQTKEEQFKDSSSMVLGASNFADKTFSPIPSKPVMRELP